MSGKRISQQLLEPSNRIEDKSSHCKALKDLKIASSRSFQSSIISRELKRTTFARLKKTRNKQTYEHCKPWNAWQFAKWKRTNVENFVIDVYVILLIFLCCTALCWGIYLVFPFPICITSTHRHKNEEENEESCLGVGIQRERERDAKYSPSFNDRKFIS